MSKEINKRSSRGRTPEGDPNPIDVHVGNRIRLRRNLLGLSQEKLAALLGLTFQQIQKYERGMNRVGASRLWDIGKVLEAPIEYFFAEMDKAVADQSPMTFCLPNARRKARDDHMVNRFKDPMQSKEAIQLVTNYFKIPNRKAAKQLFDLAETMSKTSYFAQGRKDDKRSDEAA